MINIKEYLSWQEEYDKPGLAFTKYPELHPGISVWEIQKAKGISFPLKESLYLPIRNLANVCFTGSMDLSEQIILKMFQTDSETITQIGVTSDGQSIMALRTATITPVDASARLMYLNYAMVHPQCQQKGLSTILLSRLIERAKPRVVAAETLNPRTITSFVRAMREVGYTFINPLEITDDEFEYFKNLYLRAILPFCPTEAGYIWSSSTDIQAADVIEQMWNDQNRREENRWAYLLRDTGIYDPKVDGQVYLLGLSRGDWT